MFPKEKYINFILQNITTRIFFKHFIDIWVSHQTL